MAKHAATTPASTQSAHPWRATVRTLFAAVIAFASMWGVIVAAAGLDEGIGWVASSLAITAGITRIMALPAVEAFIRTFLPWLAPDSNTEGK